MLLTEFFCDLANVITTNSSRTFPEILTRNLDSMDSTRHLGLWADIPEGAEIMNGEALAHFLEPVCMQYSILTPGSVIFCLRLLRVAAVFNRLIWRVCVMGLGRVYHIRLPICNPNLNHNPNRNLTPTLTPNSS